jgi:AcrR family transcriptional regulator
MSKEQLSQNTEEKILKAAKEVFMENGLDNTRMQDIAERAGISRTSLNYYFRTKENLFQMLLDQFFEGIVPELENVFGKGPFSLDKMDAIIDIYDKKLKSNSFIPGFVFMVMQRNPKLISQYLLHSQKVQIYLSFISEAIGKEMEAGNIRKLPIEHIIPTISGLLFSPYLIDPVLSEYWGHDDNKREEFFAGNIRNAKLLIKTLLTPVNEENL